LTEYLAPVRKTFDRAQPSAGCAGTGETIAKAFGDIAHARAAIERQQFQARSASRRYLANDNFTPLTVLNEIAGHLGHDNGGFSAEHFVSTDPLTHCEHTPSGKADLAFFKNGNVAAGSHG
jgi:hypothetical protein